MPGDVTATRLESLGEFILNAEHTFARTDQGYDGEEWIYQDSDANVLRRQMWSLSLNKWTEFGYLGTAPITTITGATTLDDSDYFVLCDASGGAFTVTLPAAASHTGRIYHIKKTDSSANAVTTDGNASETIDGATTQVNSTQYNSISIVSDGSNWHIY